MHLWPTTKIRDSYKVSYLKNVERNLERMNNQKQLQQKQKQQSEGLRQRLLDDPDKKSPAVETHNPRLLWELFTVISCCYCCGAEDDDDGAI